MTYRAPYGGLRSARWLRSFKYGPMVTAFRNLESGQVVFCQTIHPQQFNIDKQFKYHNWENKQPTLRKDLWRPLAVTEVDSHDNAVQLYKNLVQLRHMRDHSEKRSARVWRKKSDEGNIWYWNQYRPTYTHEAVSDIISAIDAMGVSARVHWDADYRKGDDAAWEDLEVAHEQLPRHNPREQSIVLNQLRVESLARAKEIQAGRTKEQQAAVAAALAAGEPTPRDIAKEASAKRYLARRKRHEAQNAQREKLLSSDALRRDVQAKKDVVERAEVALAVEKAKYDHFLPHGQRGAAKAPIKLRDRALRTAKRAYRQAKRWMAARNNKRRVPQPRSRLTRR